MVSRNFDFISFSEKVVPALTDSPVFSARDVPIRVKGYCPHAAYSVRLQYN
jgi:hypothetical protein